MWRGPKSDVWYDYKIVNGKRVQRSTGEAEKARAERVIAEWRRAEADPYHRGADEATLADAIEWLMADRRRKKRAEGTLEMYEQKSAHLARIWGETMPLSMIEAGKVDDYITQRENEGAKANTVHKELVALRSMLKLARRRKAFHLYPSDVIPSYSPNYVPRTTAIEPSQWPKLLEHLPAGRREHIGWHLATGANLSEAYSSAPEHIGPTSVFIDGTKTGYRERHVPILPHTRALIEAARPYLPFAHWSNMWRDLATACEKAELPKLTSNDLRRSFCSMLVVAGVPFDIAAKVMGHGSTKMITEVYGQFKPQHIQSLVLEHFQGSLQQDSNNATATTGIQLPKQAVLMDDITGKNSETTVGLEGVEPSAYGLKVRSLSLEDTSETAPTPTRLQQLVQAATVSAVDGDESACLAELSAIAQELGLYDCAPIGAATDKGET